MSQFPGNVLVTSASRKVPLLACVRAAVRRVHCDMKVIAGDANPLSLARYAADGFWEMPSLGEGVLPGLIQGCRERDIRFVIPTRDGELDFWACHQEALRQHGVTAFVSEPPMLRRCIDKLTFAQFGSANDLPVIAASEHLDRIDSDRIVVKERFGAGSRGIGIDLDRVSAAAHARRLLQPIFQPYVAGSEISIDAWMDRNYQPKAVVLRWRDLIENGESQVTTTFRNPRLEAQALRILRALSLRGPVVMQAIIDASDALRVIEVNARFGGASTASIAVGMDPWYWSLAEALGMEVSACSFSRLDGEVRQVRVPTDMHFHAAHF